MYISYNRHKPIYNILLFLSAAAPSLILALGPRRSDNAADVLFPALFNVSLIMVGLYLIFKKEMIGAVIKRFKANDTVLTLLSAILIGLFLGQRIYIVLGCVPAYIKAELLLALPFLFFVLGYAGVRISDFLKIGGIETEKSRRACRIKHLSALMTIILIQFILYSGAQPDAFNMTVMGFSYDFGFISRGFIGTIIRLLALLTGTQVTLEMTLIFILTSLILWAGVLISLFILVIKKAVSTVARRSIVLLTFVFALGFGFSTFIRDFGRLDIYLMILTSASCILIIKHKTVFLVIPLTLIAVLIHQGYILMYFNLVLACLFYKGFIFGECRKSYKIILISSLILCSALFMYLQFFSHAKVGLTLEQVTDYIGLITGQSGVRTDIIKQELFNEEVQYIGGNIYELLAAALLLSPCFAFITGIWKNIITGVKDRKRKWFYGLLPFGVLTLLPLYILETDRGRWTYALFFYELLLPLLLIAAGDSTAESAVIKAMRKLMSRPGLSILTFTYMFILGPFHVIEINGLSSWLISIFY